MSVIVVSGMISAGKSSIAKVIGGALGSDVFYEKVEDNEILPLFYTAPPEEQEAKRYPFLLQLDFLNSRFKDIKSALRHPHNVLDRSIYEDFYFCKVNTELGRISQTEFSIYTKLLDNMMEELEELPKKSPDLMIYLTGSFDTILHRIGLRGREFEQDQGLYDYYYKLWSGYDEWLEKCYDKSEVLTFNIDELDFVNNPEDEEYVVAKVKDKLKEMELL